MTLRHRTSSLVPLDGGIAAPYEVIRHVLFERAARSHIHVHIHVQLPRQRERAIVTSSTRDHLHPEREPRASRPSGTCVAGSTITWRIAV